MNFFEQINYINSHVQNVDSDPQAEVISQVHEAIAEVPEDV